MPDGRAESEAGDWRGKRREGEGEGEGKGGEVKVYTECCCVRFETHKHSPPVVFQALAGMYMYMYSLAFYIFTCTSSELSADSSSKMASVLRTAWPASSTRGTVNFT